MSPPNTYRGRQHSAQATLSAQPPSSLLANVVQEIARHVDVQGARPRQQAILVLAACIGGVHLEKKTSTEQVPNKFKWFSQTDNFGQVMCTMLKTKILE